MLTMKISTYDEFVEAYSNRLRKTTINPESREDALKQFPFSIVLLGSYSDHDFCTRWCWENFGPMQGECHEYQSEFPGCPLVLATEYLHPVKINHGDGIEECCQEKAYNNPGDHSHIGDWKKVWLGKIGYDFGFAEYFFLNKEDRNKLEEEFKNGITG